MIIKRGNFIRHSKAAQNCFIRFPQYPWFLGGGTGFWTFFSRSWGAEFSFVEPTRQQNYFVPLFDSLNDFAR